MHGLREYGLQGELFGNECGGIQYCGQQDHMISIGHSVIFVDVNRTMYV